MCKSKNFLPPGREEEVANKITRRAILAFAKEHLPTHVADLDEPVEPLEESGFVSACDRVADDSSVCLGFACPKKWCECDYCSKFDPFAPLH